MKWCCGCHQLYHSLLLHKLHQYAIQGTTIARITNFLSNQRHAVVVEGTRSSFNDVHSGVPKGSVRGPCLFLQNINDLPENLTSPTQLFADGTSHKHRKTISSCNKTSSDLLSGRRAGTWPFIQRSAPRCLSPESGRSRNTPTSSMDTHLIPQMLQNTLASPSKRT